MIVNVKPFPKLPWEYQQAALWGRTQPSAEAVACIRHPMVQSLMCPVLLWGLDEICITETCFAVSSLILPLTWAIISDPACPLLLPVTVILPHIWVRTGPSSSLYQHFLTDVCRTAVQHSLSPAGQDSSIQTTTFVDLPESLFAQILNCALKLQFST